MQNVVKPSPEGVEPHPSWLRMFAHALPLLCTAWLAVFCVVSGPAKDDLAFTAAAILMLPAGLFYLAVHLAFLAPIRWVEPLGDTWGVVSMMVAAGLAGLLFARHENTWAAAMTASAIWNGWTSLPRFAMRLTGRKPLPWVGGRRYPPS